MKKSKRAKTPYHGNVSGYDDVITGSKWWSRLYMNTFWGLDDNLIAAEVLDMIPDDFSGKLLDVPVGTAVFTGEKYRRMASAQIVGVDYAEPMIEIAERRKSALGLVHLTLEQGDATRLRFEDATFDSVLTMNGIHAIPDKSKALSEMARVLKPGGMIYGCTYVTGDRRLPDTLVRLVLNRVGLFAAPHYTYETLHADLEKYFGAEVTLIHHKSMAVFKCRKTK
ncbi:class I SAM-dependent methyltransferase [Porphyromonas sp.]|uniref:class I SAM-dependent methyltransferase n=1 Tax=Porphyromonas sp. TaxID=1924944 RepID=UPI0026DC1D4E|nr:class I SAM-dependent methyltransferase [Porphyromonas sp.]MDO4770949.1 class I SAM-dependent methyltransferase [Porphyromonas sp.]